MSGYFTELIELKNKYSYIINNSTSTDEIADTMLLVRELRDEIDRIRIELNKLFLFGGYKAGNMVVLKTQSLVERKMQGEDVDIDHKWKTNTCTYEYKTDLTYKTDNLHHLGESLGVHPQALENKLVSINFPNVVKFLENNQEYAQQLQASGALVLEYKPTITIRKSRKEAEDE